MSLLYRICQTLYLITSKIIQGCLLDDSDGNQLLVWLANLLIVTALLGGFCIALYALICAISLEIFLKALLIAYFTALIWEKFSQHLTSLAQELYLLMSTVGYTVLVGAAIQIHRLQVADAKALLFYWIFLLSFGFIIWLVTLFNVTADPKFKPVLSVQKIKYQHRFRRSQIAKSTPTKNPAQAYLKRMR